jgi:hypothetical protein
LGAQPVPVGKVALERAVGQILRQIGLLVHVWLVLAQEGQQRHGEVLCRRGNLGITGSPKAQALREIVAIAERRHV